MVLLTLPREQRVLSEEHSACNGENWRLLYSFFERAARTKAESAITTSNVPKTASANLTSGTEWKTVVWGTTNKPPRYAAKNIITKAAPTPWAAKRNAFTCFSLNLKLSPPALLATSTGLYLRPTFSLLLTCRRVTCAVLKPQV
jgi:hypothetical protein